VAELFAVVNDNGTYRKFFVSFWLHPGVRRLNEADRLLAIWLLTNEGTNRIGLYRLSPAQAAEELGEAVDCFIARLERVCQTFGWKFDAIARVLYIPSWWKYNPPANLNVVRGSLKDLSKVPPDCELIEAFARNVEHIPEPFREPFHELLRERL